MVVVIIISVCAVLLAFYLGLQLGIREGTLAGAKLTSNLLKYLHFSQKEAVEILNEVAKLSANDDFSHKSK